MNNDPHRDDPVRGVGQPLRDAAGAVILLHGRGGSADDILSLASDLFLPQLAYLAPQAAGNSWYPYSFLAPVAQNEPWLGSALKKIDAILLTAKEAGFSQGACLATEFVASRPRRYAGLIAFTGGLIGPPGADLAHPGNLSGTPAFFGSGDPDPHVPWQRVQQSARILTGMGAEVTIKGYQNRPHTISADEIESAAMLIRDALSASAKSS
jgi:phospholipase/carboxylesterase